MIKLLKNVIIFLISVYIGDRDGDNVLRQIHANYVDTLILFVLVT